MQERIRNICEELCCRELGEKEELIASGLLDSFKIMELICSLEESFDIVFQPEEITELDNFSCISRIAEITGRKTGLGQDGKEKVSG